MFSLLGTAFARFRLVAVIGAVAALNAGAVARDVAAS